MLHFNDIKSPVFSGRAGQYPTNTGERMLLSRAQTYITADC
jgi:hypothetical protein